ncbi:MAG: hypothetical protein ABI723_00870 [Bacteroidia bacterium]
MKKTKATLILILFSKMLFGQIMFQKTYGGTSMDNAYSAQVTTDGGYIITGTSWSD